jgi:putative sigma-54 modulation protein
MQLSVHSLHFKADSKLIHFIKNRLSKLEQFQEDCIAADVYLKVDKRSEGGNKITVVKLQVPGKEFVAKRRAASFEESTDRVTEALRRQIRKRKGKTALA